MRSLAIIGAGNVGTTLGILFARHGLEIPEIASRSAGSAERARALIGAGKVVAVGDFAPAGLLMVSTGDNALHDMPPLLRGAVRPGTIVFHCSGATPSAIFAPLRDWGAHVASVHPVKTFTDPEKDSETFPGTWCGIEGDKEAVAVLEPLFSDIGARTFSIDPARKALYHGALAFACNYVFPGMEAALRCYEEAGVSREQAARMMEPIVQATVANALSLGPAKAMTGPVARGDSETVAAHLRALAAFDSGLEAFYRAMGLRAAELSAQKGAAPPEKLEQIRAMMEKGAA